QSLSLSPTLTAQMTQAGVLMGTVAYMSPEQARGQEVDKQADIWAYGVVLFEMLTGRTAFPGDTVTDVMAAVVTQEPDWNTLPPETPWHVTEVLRLCLSKDPRQRVHDIADSRLMLTSSAAPTTETSPVAEAKTWRRFLPWGVAAALAVLAGGLALSPKSHEASAEAVQSLSITLPAEASLAQNEVIVLSPDGSKLVMVGYENGARKLLLRRLDSSEIEAIPDTEGVDNPFFSPDGESLGFTRDKEMLTMSLETGRATTIARATWGGGSWGPDDTIVYTPTYTDGLHRLPAAGGDPEELTTPDLEAGELGHFWPQHLPGGDVVLFTAFSVPLTRSSIDVYDLESGTAKTLVEDGVWGRYSPTGHLLFIRDHTLMAVRLDLQKVEIEGAPVPILTDIIPDIGQGDTPVTFSANGTLAYVSGTVMDPLRQLVWVDQTGNEMPFGEARRYATPRIAPDGARIALTIRDKSWDLWSLELDRGTLSRLSFEPATQFGALWMPDGDRLVYSQDDPPYNLYRRTTDGNSQPELLVESPLDNEVRSISPDGKFLFYSVSGSESGYDLWLLPLEGDRQAEPWLATPFNEDFGAFSPDGNWVAYQSDETGKEQVYVNRFPEGGRKLQVSIDGGSRPLWSRDGQELYFWNGPRVMAVEVTAGDRMTASQPRELFRGSYMTTRNRQDYDVAADGRFLMIKTPDEDRPREINVVLNWFQELESLVPNP
ncbi:MAG: protein kinase, partial [Thermoanaerobaculia bacterium]